MRHNLKLIVKHILIHSKLFKVKGENTWIIFFIQNTKYIETDFTTCNKISPECSTAEWATSQNYQDWFFLSEGWVKTDMKFMVKKWVGRNRLNHAIQIACTTCSIDRDTAPVSVEQTLKPFLVIHTAPLPQKNRPKRNSNCLPEMKECCRDDLYINFKDIGWSEWILHPSGYHAYFCRGSCATAASLTTSGSHYNNVIRVSVI